MILKFASQEILLFIFRLVKSVVLFIIHNVLITITIICLLLECSIVYYSYCANNNYYYLFIIKM